MIQKQDIYRFSNNSKTLQNISMIIKKNSTLYPSITQSFQNEHNFISNENCNTNFIIYPREKINWKFTCNSYGFNSGFRDYYIPSLLEKRMNNNKIKNIIRNRVEHQTLQTYIILWLEIATV